MEVRFTKKIGHQKIIGKYWGATGCNGYLCHYTKELAIEKGDNLSFTDSDFDRLNEIENICFRCGCKPISDDEIKHRSCIEPIYDTESGKLEPGSLFYNDWLPLNFHFDNQIKPHLSCILPNGQEWNIDSRASNCTMPDERSHRCWIVDGNPEENNITVSKNGHTCDAGGGSIQAGNYHGFLRNGKFTGC